MRIEEINQEVVELYAEDVDSKPIDFDFGDMTYFVPVPDASEMNGRDLKALLDQCDIEIPWKTEEPPVESNRESFLAFLRRKGLHYNNGLTVSFILDAVLRSDDADKVIDFDDAQGLLDDHFNENKQPAINCIYPVHLRGVTPEEAQVKLVGLPLTIVTLENSDDHFLALTGGGMNMSWYICQAYIALRQLPPFEFCQLPDMAGESDLKVVFACIRSADIIQSRAKWALEKLDSMKVRIQTDGRL